MRSRVVRPLIDRLGLVLELVPGGRTLDQVIAAVRAGKETSRPLRWRIERPRRLLIALEAAHRRDVIHRDVEPANILVDRDTDDPKLADSGIARLPEHYGRGADGVTPRQFYARPYAAPERVRRGSFRVQPARVRTRLRGSVLRRASPGRFPA